MNEADTAHAHPSERPDIGVGPGTARPILLSALEAAHLLGIGRTTLYELIKGGELTSIHVGRSVRFSMYEIETYVQSLIQAA